MMPQPRAVVLNWQRPGSALRYAATVARISAHYRDPCRMRSWRHTGHHI